MFIQYKFPLSSIMIHSLCVSITSIHKLDTTEISSTTSSVKPGNIWFQSVKQNTTTKYELSDYFQCETGYYNKRDPKYNRIW